jgi:hypothetical protein
VETRPDRNHFQWGKASRWASSGAGWNLIPLIGFDSDPDSDPDTDACGKGSCPGSSSILTVSARHVADGGPARYRDRGLRFLPHAPEWNGVATSSSPFQNHSHWDGVLGPDRMEPRIEQTTQTKRDLGSVRRTPLSRIHAVECRRMTRAETRRRRGSGPFNHRYRVTKR